MQSALAEHNSDLPQDRRMEFRIGIHRGDVATDGTRLHGDSVNIAARIERLAEPAGCRSLRRRRLWASVAVVLLAAAGCGRGPAPDEPGVSAAELLGAQDRDDLWVHYSRNYAGWRHAPSAQINRENVHRLELKWEYPTGTREEGFETTAIVFDDRLYITTPGNRLIRMDPKAGTPVWQTEFFGWKTGVNRGVAVQGNRLYMAAINAHLLCFDADTGLQLWDRTVADHRGGHRLSSAPLVVKDKVIVGISGAEYGVRGFIDAYFAETGKRAWRFWVVPGPGEPGNETWEGDSWKHGGGSAWLTGTYDPELDLLYWGTSNPAPDFNGEVREGDNLYTNSIVALDPDTGKLVWHFQTTPHDVFDWSGVAEPILVDGEFDGRQVKAVVQANRNGYLYVLDRTDGRLIRATPYTEANWARLDESGRPRIREELLSQTRRHVLPGIAGGSNWPPASYSPRTHLLYVPDIVKGTTYLPGAAVYRRGKMFLGGFAEMDKGPAQGSIQAIDLRTGEARWSFDTSGPNWGGLLSTGGGLVFGGAFDGFLRAFDEATGEVLWEFQTKTGVYAPPTTFTIDGRQYVGLASGFGRTGNSTSRRLFRPRRGIYYLFGLPEG